MRLIAKSMTGLEFELKVEPSDTILSVKQAIEARARAPVNRLTFYGKQLQEADTLDDCGLSDLVSVMFILRRPVTECVFCNLTFEEGARTSQILMGCGHTMCSACVQQVSTGLKFVVCPLDKQSSVVANLRRNYAACAFWTDPSAQAPVCDVCEDHPATWRCLDCGEAMCDQVQPHHTTTRVTKGHQVVSLKEASLTMAQAPLFCKDHPAEAHRFYCGPCKRLVCRDCCMLEHQDHARQALPQAADALRAEIAPLVQAACARQEELQRGVTSVGDMRRFVNTSHATSERQLAALRVQIMEAVDKHCLQTTQQRRRP
jgi:hypothetical protein